MLLLNSPYMCVEVGDALFLDHHIASIYNLFAHPQHLQRTPWTPGLPGLLTRGIISSTSTIDNIVVAFVCNSRILYVVIELYVLHCEFETAAPVIPDSFMSGCAPHLRYLELERTASHFQDCRNYCLSNIYLPLTLSNFIFLLILIPDILHPRRWSPESLC